MLKKLFKTVGITCLLVWMWSLIVDAVIPAIREFTAEDKPDGFDEFKDCEEYL